MKEVKEGGVAYTTEEVSNEDNEHALGDIGSRVEVLEQYCLSVFVQQWHLCNALQHLLGGKFIVRVDLAGEVSDGDVALRNCD